MSLLMHSARAALDRRIALLLDQIFQTFLARQLIFESRLLQDEEPSAIPHVCARRWCMAHISFVQ